MVDIRKQNDSLIDLACCTFKLSDESRITVKFSSPHEHTLKEPRKYFITLAHTLSHFLVNINGDEATSYQTLKYQLNLLLMDRLRQFISRTMLRVNRFLPYFQQCLYQNVSVLMK